MPNHFIIGIIFKPSDKEDTLAGPTAKHGVIDIGPVHDDNRTGVERQLASHVNVVLFGWCDQDIGRHVIIMIQQNMRFHSRLWRA